MGGGVGSYRFGEVMGLGGIPIVLPDFLSPMWPDLDWSGCIVLIKRELWISLESWGRFQRRKFDQDKNDASFCFNKQLGGIKS